MSGQTSDNFIFKDIQYYLGSIEYPFNFIEWDSFKLNPIEFDTSCWRGFISTFGIKNDLLVLDRIYTNNGNNENKEISLINGVMPEIIKPEYTSDEYNAYRILDYKNLNYQIKYTGSILIVKDYIQKYYHHFGFQSPVNYKTVIKLTFIDGKLKEENDLSSMVENIRNSRSKNKNKSLNSIFFNNEVHKLFVDFKTIDNLNNLYINCMNCKINCPNIMKNIPHGIPPRGFYFLNIPIKILIIGKNPGHPLKDEKDMFKNKNGEDLFLNYRKYQNNLYSNILSNKEKSTTFHKNLFRYISYFLDMPNDIKEIYKYVAHTNLLKCSTTDEQQKLRNCKEAVDNCFNTYLLSEIKYMQPKVLLALGKEVYKYLNKKDLQIPIICIKHPSYYYKKNEETEILNGIKNEINNICM